MSLKAVSCFYLITVQFMFPSILSTNCISYHVHDWNTLKESYAVCVTENMLLCVIFIWFDSIHVKHSLQLTSNWNMTPGIDRYTYVVVIPWFYFIWTHKICVYTKSALYLLNINQIKNKKNFQKMFISLYQMIDI